MMKPGTSHSVSASYSHVPHEVKRWGLEDPDNPNSGTLEASIMEFMDSVDVVYAEDRTTLQPCRQDGCFMNCAQVVHS